MNFRSTILLVLVMLLAACGEPAPTPQPGEVTLKDVAFEAASGKEVAGNIKLIQVGDKYSLRLSDNFSVSAGPDLHVWLLEDETDTSNPLDLGKLSGNSGAQEFAIPVGTDLDSYKVVYIWCEQVSELFAKALLDDTNPNPNPTPTTLFTGTLSGDSEGTLEIVQTGEARTLNLSGDFKANGTNNVDLWLATDATGSTFIELPGLQTQGAQTFDIPASVDLAVYKYVVVWCDDVDVVIGTAALVVAGSTPPIEPPTPPTPPSPQTIFTGTLSGDSVGTVEIVQTGSDRVLNLSSNFRANGTNNVDLWLAPNASGEGFIEFDNFKTTGAQTFNIPASVDLSVYKYIVVWCADVSTVIGIAELMSAN
jgi:Electron transfer DM13